MYKEQRVFDYNAPVVPSVVGFLMVRVASFLPSPLFTRGKRGLLSSQCLLEKLL